MFVNENMPGNLQQQIFEIPDICRNVFTKLFGKLKILENLIFQLFRDLGLNIIWVWDQKYVIIESKHHCIKITSVRKLDASEFFDW